MLSPPIPAKTSTRRRVRCYWVPHWYKGTHWLATWDVFGRPETKPRYGLPFASAWWFDSDKAAKIGIRV
jgi:ABC-type oligopeptide transport system substrate-binding subunit